jgi:hypothetical protein
VFVEQAIFTSVRSGRNEGYQIAATSPGVTSDEQRELAKWGPAHDSLYDAGPAAESCSFHRLESGLYCLSRTVSAGREYSGRGGCRVYTQSFLLPHALLARFHHHPLRILEALVVSGRATVLSPVPDHLDPVPILGRASPVKVTEIERLCQALGPERLTALVCAALQTELLGIVAPVRPRLLLAGLLNLLPPQRRAEFSWTTGLRVSPRRPYRWAVLPADREEQRQALRLLHLTTLDLCHDVPAKFAAHGGWPLVVYNLLRTQQFSTLADVVQAATDTEETDTDILAEQAWARLDQPAAADAFTPWSPTGFETAGTSSDYREGRPMPQGGIAR